MVNTCSEIFWVTQLPECGICINNADYTKTFNCISTHL